MATTLVSNTDIGNFFVQKGEKGSHGNLYWAVTNGKDARSHPRIQISDFKDPLKAPFGLTNFGESGRQNLDLSVSDPLIQDFFDRIDKWCIAHVEKNLKEFFPKKPPASLLEAYCPLLSRKDNFCPLVRTKINNNCTVFKIENGSSKGSLDDVVTGSLVCPICSVSKIWTMNGRFGCTLVTEALIVWPRREKSIDELFFRSEIDEFDCS